MAPLERSAASTAAVVAWTMSASTLRTCTTAFFDWPARLLISSATTLNPLPSSADFAASMAALTASRLDCSAMSCEAVVRAAMASVCSLSRTMLPLMTATCDSMSSMFSTISPSARRPASAALSAPLAPSARAVDFWLASIEVCLTSSTVVAASLTAAAVCAAPLASWLETALTWIVVCSRSPTAPRTIAAMSRGMRTTMTTLASAAPANTAISMTVMIVLAVSRPLRWTASC